MTRIASLIVLAALWVCPAGAAVILETPQALFVGITVRSVAVDGSVGLAAAIDLTAPGISFTGTAPAPAGVTVVDSQPPQQAETIAQTTSQFLLATQTQYAINAGFFSPCCTAANEGKDISGLTVSNGVLVSPLDPTRPATLLVGAGNAVTIGDVTTAPAGVLDAVTGSDILVSGGRNVAPTASTDFNNANPRTAAGLSQDGHTLFLLTIDGRQANYSAGATLAETADVLLALGATSGLNLDGGGSTAAVASDGQGGARLLNQPSGGTERYDAGNFGVYALALPMPEPGSAGVLLIGLAACVWGETRRRITV